jgi:hypothetical protein
MAAMRRTVLPLAALLAFALALTACGDSDDDVDVTGAPTTGADDSTPTPTDEPDDSTTSSDAPASGVGAIWEPSDPNSDATEVAIEFATEYLGIAGAQTDDDDSDAGCAADVPVVKGSATVTTTVHVAQGEEGCVVVGASSESIVVDAPGAGAEIVSPVSVSGRANAFEGTVVVQVRPAGSTSPIGESFVTGATGELGPFEGSVDFASGTEAGGGGAVVLYAPDESGEGTAIYATVVPVTFA